MELKFKNGDWVAHTCDVFGPRHVQPDTSSLSRRQPQAPLPPRPKIGKATYIGRIKKIVIEEEQVTYYVVFGPEDKWKPFDGNQLEDAAIMINPPRSAPAGMPTDSLDDSDFRARNGV